MRTIQPPYKRASQVKGKKLMKRRLRRKVSRAHKWTASSIDWQEEGGEKASRADHHARGKTVHPGVVAGLRVSEHHLATVPMLNLGGHQHAAAGAGELC